MKIAQEFLKIALEHRFKSDEPEFKKILKEIENAAKKGETFIFYYKDINPVIKQKLLIEGFAIEDLSDRDGVIFKISIII